MPGVLRLSPSMTAGIVACPDQPRTGATRSSGGRWPLVLPAVLASATVLTAHNCGQPNDRSGGLRRKPQTCARDGRIEHRKRQFLSPASVMHAFRCQIAHLREKFAALSQTAFPDRRLLRGDAPSRQYRRPRFPQLFRGKPAKHPNWGGLLRVPLRPLRGPSASG